MTPHRETNEKTVWIVSEGSPGHDSQSQGLAAALAERVRLDIHTIRARATVRGWMRPLVRAWMGQTGRPLSPTLLRWFTDMEGERLRAISALWSASVPASHFSALWSASVPASHFENDGCGSTESRPPVEASGGAGGDTCAELPPPDLVISSGGKSVFAARTFAARHGVPYVYLGEQKRFPNRWFDVIVSPVPDDPRPNAIETELLPTPMSPTVVERAAANHDRPDGRLWTMVIGGASRSHRYRREDWRDLAQSMNALAERENIRWLITTSRRTGADAEGILRDNLAPEFIADAIWWSKKPRRELHAFLGMAEIAFVTQDSVTMVTEAVASGRPVVVLRPHGVRFPPDSFMPAYLGRLEKNARINCSSMHQLRDCTILPDAFSPLAGSTVKKVATTVANRLNWMEPSQ